MKSSILFAAFGVFLVLAPAMAQDVPTEPPAIEERVPEHLAYIYDQAASPGAPVSSQVYARERQWEAGQTLKVCFFGGNPVVKALIAMTAKEWEVSANLKFDFGADGQRNCRDTGGGFSQIRIGFAEKGYWSAIGADSNGILNQMQPSMNLERFDLRYGPYQGSTTGVLYSVKNVAELANENDRGTIRHEFGHAISLLHEHQSAKLGCQKEIRWDGPGNIYDYYARAPNNWSREEVDRNVGPIADAYPDAVEGDPDRLSLMMYQQPAAIFIKGVSSPCFVGRNNRISEKDARLAAKLYPRNVAAISDTDIRTTPLRGAVVTPAVAASPAAASDLLERANIDLQSSDVSVRREARRQLAVAVAGANSGSLVALMLKSAEQGPYRTQLGVLVAIEKGGGSVDLTAAEKASAFSSLRSISKSNQDPTLRGATTRVGKVLTQ